MNKLLKKLIVAATPILQYFQPIFELTKGSNPYKYTLLGDHLFTKQRIRVENSRVKIIKWGYSTSKHAESIDDDVYLLLLYEDNLAHFFHDIFFPLYVMWRSNNKKILHQSMKIPF